MFCLLRPIGFVALLIALTFGGMTPPAAAQPPTADPLLVPAAILPANTFFYAAVRLDDATLGSLDAILATFRERLPADAVSPSTRDMIALLASLDVFGQRFFGGDFATSIRPWLGDVGAAALIRPDINLLARDFRRSRFSSFYAPVFILQIRDRAGAAAALEQFFQKADGVWQKTEDTAFQTVFTQGDISNFSASAIAIRDDSLIISTNIGLESLPLVTNSLADAPHFQKTLSRMPLPHYTAVVFTNARTWLEQGIGSSFYASYYGFRWDTLMVLTPLMRAAGYVGVGFTSLDADTITMDTIFTVGNTAPLKALGFTFTQRGRALIPEFAARVPGNAFAVIHGADLAASAETFWEAAGHILSTFTLQSFTEDAALIEGLKRPFNVVLSNLIGFDYERDLSGWIRGDYALFLSDAGGVTIDAGLMFAVSDAASARQFLRTVESELGITLTLLGVRDVLIDSAWTHIRDTEVLVIKVVPLYGGAPFEIVLAADEAILVMGSRGAVESVLTPTEESASLRRVRQYTLPTAGMGWYVVPGQLTSRFDALALLAPNDYQRRQYETYRTLTTLLRDASISGAVNEHGDLLLRFTVGVR